MTEKSATKETAEKDATASEDDYRNDKGVLICGKCGQAKEHLWEKWTDSKGRVYPAHLVRCTCRCDDERAAREQAERDEIAHNRKVKHLRKECFATAGRYANFTFDMDDMRNSTVSNIARRFADTFDPEYDMGLILYGECGTGKSFHAACIANAAIEREHTCLVTDISQVVNIMQDKFEGRSERLERILSPDLLILEDLGAQRTTEYVMEHVYGVIDGRYKMGKPMVITTNFDYRYIRNPPADSPWKRVFDRILEMCYPVRYESVRADGKSRRRESGQDKLREMQKRLGIGALE